MRAPADSAETEYGPADIGSQPVLSNASGDPERDGLKAHLQCPEESRYRTRYLLGRGGMGWVVAAHDARLGRDIAIKSASPEAPADSIHDDRIAHEARITAGLDHPGIVPILDAGVGVDGRVFYTMPIVRGRTLADVLKVAVNSTERLALLRRILEACEAVGWAHRKGIVHRDLKPTNIMIGEGGGTRVLDWGLASMANEEATGLVGTPSYMSPEQTRGTRPDPRSDVWSLGAVLFEVVTGRPLRPVNLSLAELSELVRGEDQGWPLEIEHMSPELGAVLRRTLRSDPVERYSDALELAADLERLLEGRRVEAHVYSTRELLVRLAKAWKGPLLVGAGAILLVIVLLSLGLDRLSDEAQRAHEARDDAMAAELASRSARDDAERAERDAKLASERTREELARSLVLQAELHSASGNRAMAEVMAIRALELTESPSARGVLAHWAVQARPTLLERVPLPQCIQHFLDGAGRRIYCRESFALSAWDLRAGHFVLAWRQPHRVTTLEARGEQVWAFLVGARLVKFSRDDGRILATGLSQCEAEIRFEGGGILTANNGCFAFEGERARITGMPCRGQSWLGAVAVDKTGEHWRAFCENGMLATGPVVASDGVSQWRQTRLGSPGHAISGVGVGDGVVVGTARGEVVLVEPVTGQSLRTVHTGFSKVVSVTAANLEGWVGARSATGDVAVVDLEDGIVHARFEAQHSVDFGFISGEFVTLGDDFQRYRISESTPCEFALESGVTSIAFHPSGQFIAMATGDRIETRRIRDGARVDGIAGDGNFIKSVAWSKFGNFLYAAAAPTRKYDGPRLGVWEFPGAAPGPEDLRLEARRVVVLNAGLSESDDVILAAPYHRGLDAISRGFGGMRPLIPPTQRMAELNASAGGRFAAAIAENDGAVWRIRADPLEAELVGFIPGGQGVAISRDGALIAVAQADVISLIDAETTKVSTLLLRPGARFSALALSPNSRWLGAGTREGQTLIFDFDSRRLTAELQTHEEGVFSAAFSPDESILATASWDGRVKLLDLRVLAMTHSELRAEWLKTSPRSPP